MLRFLFPVSIALCCLPHLGCSNNDSTATAKFILNQTEHPDPGSKPPTAVEKSQQLERYAQSARGYRVMHAALNKPGIRELECVKQAVKTDEPESWLAKQTTVEVVAAKEMLILKVSGSTPEQALALCRAVTDVFPQYVAGDERNALLKERHRLHSSYAERATKLQVKRNNLGELTKSFGSEIPQDELESERAKLNALTHSVEDRGRLLERLNAQLQQAAAPLSLLVPPHVPGFEPDDSSQGVSILLRCYSAVILTSFCLLRAGCANDSSTAIRVCSRTQAEYLARLYEPETTKQRLANSNGLPTLSADTRY